MQAEVVLSGFGGQGALFAGQVLAFTALEAGKHVTWIPSYGPEMRGGTAHCTVIVSDEQIGSPIVRNPSAAIVLNIPSLERYEPLVRAGGVLVVNASLVDRAPQRADVRSLMIPATETAESLGEKRMANMVLLGAYLQAEPIFSLEAVGTALANHIAEHRRKSVPANLEALRRGAAMAQQQLVAA
ncbi:MAG TPA: 2-oxoacid:acceptor oxidoreductase family protein [Anaerolineales bacterium]|nr:2-oxoacid:acceptor oxidoreductase family protein [Anaerolineales bacterium]